MRLPGQHHGVLRSVCVSLGPRPSWLPQGGLCVQAQACLPILVTAEWRGHSVPAATLRPGPALPLGRVWGPHKGACHLPGNAGALRGPHDGGRELGRGRQPDLPAPLQEEFPVREDPSDVTDEDTGPAQPPPPPKAPIPSFRLKNDSDLFGLGLEETGRKGHSSEGSRALGAGCLRPWSSSRAAQLEAHF